MTNQNMMGKYKGRRVAHVIDKTLGGKLCVVFGRLSACNMSQGHYMTRDLSIAELASWCEKYKAKRIEVYPEP